MASPPRSPALVSCYAYCGGCRWHWRQTHDSFPGQPVVLVHGALATSAGLIPLAEAIAGWAPVLAPDLPGFGRSTGGSAAPEVPALAAALAEWMRMAEVSPAHVVGSSFGSQIAAELAAGFPQRVRSLTLIGPTLDPTARNLGFKAARFFADLSREPLRLWRNQAGEYGWGNGVRPRFGAIRAMLCDRIEAKLPRVRAPGLVLRGAFDPIAPESWTRRAARLMPDASSVSLTDGAHWVHFSHPALVAAAIRNFTFPLRQPLSG